MPAASQVQHLIAQVAEIVVVNQLFPALPLPRAKLHCAALKVRI